MNRQTSLVTALSGVTIDETEEKQEPVCKRKALLPTPTGDGDRGPFQSAKPNSPEIVTQEPSISSNHPTLSPTGCGYYLITKSGFRVDVCSNGNVRIYNSKSKSVVAFRGDTEEVGLISPFGRVHMYNEILNATVGDKIAKMSSRGVTFTAKGKPIVYLIDPAGCKSTTDKFKPLSEDFTTDLLFKNVKARTEDKQAAEEQLKKVTKETAITKDRIFKEVWKMSDFVVTVDSKGTLTLCKPNKRFFIAFYRDGQIKFKISKFSLIVRREYTSLVKFASELPSDGSNVEIAVDQSIKVDRGRLTAKSGAQRAYLDARNELVLSGSV